jgi:hypothetical protein
MNAVPTATPGRQCVTGVACLRRHIDLLRVSSALCLS